MRRALTVTRVEMLSASMKRVHLGGEDLATFESAAPDDHVKLFFPQANGEVARRDYTPRAFDTAQRSLVIDFVLHEDGPATNWARAAEAGAVLEVGGPRGSAVIADDFDWYWLIGDEAALPAIARRLEELRPGVPVRAVLLCDGMEHRIALPEREGLAIQWVHRTPATSDATALVEAVGTAALPAGEGFVWIAAEAEAARAVRTHVVERLDQPNAWVKASGYWISGAEGEQTRIED